MIRWKKGYKMLGLFLIVAMLTGCSSKTATVEEVMEEIKTTKEAETENLKLDFDDVILQVESYDVTYREVLFYIFQAKHNYEDKLSGQVWDVVLESGDTLEEFAKQQILKQMTEVKIICLRADKDGVTLSKKEEDKVNQDVSAFLETLTEDEKERYGIEHTMLESIYKENAIAAKMYNNVTESSEQKEEKGNFEKEYEKWSENVDIKMSIGLWKKISIHTLAE